MGEELVQYFRTGNIDAVNTLLSEVDGLRENVTILHVSSDALYCVATGINPNENALQFLDEQILLNDLGLNPIGPPTEHPYIYQGSGSESDNELDYQDESQ